MSAAPHCSAHTQFEYDCIECGDACRAAMDATWKTRPDPDTAEAWQNKSCVDHDDGEGPGEEDGVWAEGWRERFDASRDNRLFGQQPKPDMPLPPEPTSEMLDAAAKVVFEDCEEPWGDGTGYAQDLVREVQKKCYEAMAKVVVADYERKFPGLTEVNMRGFIVYNNRDFPTAPTEGDMFKEVSDATPTGKWNWLEGARWAHERWLTSLGVKR